MAMRALSFLALTLLCGGSVFGGCSPRAEPPPEAATIETPPPLGAASPPPPQSDSRDGGASALDAAVLDGGTLPDSGAPSSPDSGVSDAATDGSIVHAMPPPDGGPTSCDPNATWSMDQELSISANGLDELFGSISYDERTLAWTTEQGHVKTSDRASTAVAFQNRRSVLGTYAVDRVALSADGLRLAIVSEDRRSMLEATRSSRTDPFDSPTEGAFAIVDRDALAMAVDEGFADPVFSPDDRTFLYTRYGAGRVATVLRSERLFAGDPWPVGASIGIPELDAQGPLRRRPTGFSSDARALFFWDDAANVERAGFFSAQSDAFIAVVTLGVRRGAMPNAACDRIYFSATGNSLGLFSATATQP